MRIGGLATTGGDRVCSQRITCNWTPKRLLLWYSADDTMVFKMGLLLKLAICGVKKKKKKKTKGVDKRQMKGVLDVQ